MTRKTPTARWKPDGKNVQRTTAIRQPAGIPFAQIAENEGWHDSMTNRDLYLLKGPQRDDRARYVRSSADGPDAD